MTGSQQHTAVGRLRTSRDFSRVLSEGRSGRRPEIVLYHLARPSASASRVGFVVNRRIGTAVVRNRVKRVLREAVRPWIERLDEPADVVVVARPGAVALNVAQAGRTVREAAEQAGVAAGLD